jgi:hypothetical protein
MSRFAPAIKVSETIQRPIPEKEILWGSQGGGCNRFPLNRETINERRFADDPMHLQAFGRAVSDAQARVWIVDEYLLMPDTKTSDNTEKVKQKIHSRIATILHWFPLQLVASDIRFLTKHHAEIEACELEKFQKHAQDINNYSVRRKTQCNIEVRTHLTQKFDFIHDRFAIIDDELWHFGATVGGFHAKVSAASRGWRASDHGAIEFFKMAWDTGVKK